MVLTNTTVEVRVRVMVGVGVLVGIKYRAVVVSIGVELGFKLGPAPGCWLSPSGVQVTGSLGWVGVLLGINRAAGIVGGGRGLICE